MPKVQRCSCMGRSEPFAATRPASCIVRLSPAELRRRSTARRDCARKFICAGPSSRRRAREAVKQTPEQSAVAGSLAGAIQVSMRRSHGGSGNERADAVRYTLRAIVRDDEGKAALILGRWQSRSTTLGAAKAEVDAGRWPTDVAAKTLEILDPSDMVVAARTFKGRNVYSPWR